MEEVIIKERQLRENISKVINDAKLPAIIIKPILKEYYEQIAILEQQQYEQARQAIEKDEQVRLEEKVDE